MTHLSITDAGHRQRPSRGEGAATGDRCGAQDQWLVTFLQSGPSWQLDGDELALASGETKLVLLDRSVAKPAPPIEGTKWLLKTIYSGQTASSAPTGPYLIFADDKVTGSTGCNAQPRSPVPTSSLGTSP